MYNRFLFISLIIGIILVSGYLINDYITNYKITKVSGGFGLCHLRCGSVVYDSKSIVETKDDVRTVFDQYLKEANLSLVYNITEKTQDPAKYPRLNISDMFYGIVPNCDKCSVLYGVTIDGKICSITLSPC